MIHLKMKNILFLSTLVFSSAIWAGPCDESMIIIKNFTSDSLTVNNFTSLNSSVLIKSSTGNIIPKNGTFHFKASSATFSHGKASGVILLTTEKGVKMTLNYNLEPRKVKNPTWGKGGICYATTSFSVPDNALIVNPHSQVAKPATVIFDIQEK